MPWSLNAPPRCRSWQINWHHISRRSEPHNCRRKAFHDQHGNVAQEEAGSATPDRASRPRRAGLSRPLLMGPAHLELPRTETQELEGRSPHAHLGEQQFCKRPASERSDSTPSEPRYQLRQDGASQHQRHVVTAENDLTSVHALPPSAAQRLEFVGPRLHGPFTQDRHRELHTVDAKMLRERAWSFKPAPQSLHGRAPDSGGPDSCSPVAARGLLHRSELFGATHTAPFGCKGTVAADCRAARQMDCARAKNTPVQHP